MKPTNEHISLAQNAAQGPVWVDTSAALARAAKGWSRATMLAIDTEFVRERTYYAKLGLVQISDAQTVWLIDVPALDTLDLLADMFTNCNIIKVLHGASEDLEILWQTLDVVPNPFFDSQVAAAMVGFPLQMGYEQLINELLPVEILKGPSRSDWLQRPLTDAQIIYASNDVAYLPLAAKVLQYRLQQKQRHEWHYEDMQKLVLHAQQPVQTDHLYQRVKGAANLNGSGLAYLQLLAAWRDAQARQRDLPRSFVISDIELIAIAEAAVKHTDIQAESIQALEQLHPKVKRRYASELASMLNNLDVEPLKELPGRPDPQQRQQLANLQAAVKKTSAQHELEPTLLASKRILQSLQRHYIETNQQELLPGWRGHLLNSQILAILSH